MVAIGGFFCFLSGALMNFISILIFLSFEYENNSEGSVTELGVLNGCIEVRQAANPFGSDILANKLRNS